LKKRPRLTEYRFDQWAGELRDWIKASVSPFEDDTPEKQAERISRGKWDKLYFFETYLPHYFSKPCEDFHEEWAGLSDVQEEIIPIAAPRRHAKSTFFTFGVPVHDCAYQNKHFDMIISDSNDQATGFTLPIRIELEENPRLIHDFGNFRGRRWRDADFTTAHGVRILARGRGEKVRGLKNLQYRPDRVIIDDLENDKNVKNPRLVKEALDWLLTAVLGSLADNYSFLMVGNLFAPRSVLSQLINAKDEETGEKLYPLAKVYDCYREDDSPLWPDMWPKESLEKLKRRMGTVRFNREMRNKVGAEESPIREEWILYVPAPEILIPKVWQVAAFLDPSGKGTETTDFKSIVAVGQEKDSRMMEVLHAWIRHATVNAMWDAVWQICEEFGCGMGVEINMFEDFLIDSYKAHAEKSGRFIRLVKMRHTTDKIARIVNRLAPLVEFGKLRFRKGQSDQDILVEQLIYIMDTNVNDDGPDALESAVAQLQGTGGAISVGVDPEERETMTQRRPGLLGRVGGVFGRFGRTARASIPQHEREEDEAA